MQPASHTKTADNFLQVTDLRGYGTSDAYDAADHAGQPGNEPGVRRDGQCAKRYRPERSYMDTFLITPATSALHRLTHWAWC